MRRAISDFLFGISFGIRHSTLSFHIADRRESHDRFADSRALGRGDNFIDVFVRWPSFLGETGPRSAADVNAARFEIALKLLAMPLFARPGAAHGAAAPVCGAKESFCA